MNGMLSIIVLIESFMVHGFLFANCCDQHAITAIRNIQCELNVGRSGVLVVDDGGFISRQ